MADINSADYNRKNINSGTYGNLSVANGTITAAGEAAATVYHFMTLQRGTKIVDSHLIAAALGTGVTGKLSVKGLTSGTVTDLTAATVFTSAGRASQSVAPVTLTEDSDVIVTTGVGAATGALDAVIQYEYRGV